MVITNATASGADLPEPWRVAVERDRMGFFGGADPAPERRAARMLAAFVITGLVFLALPGTLLGVWNLLSIVEHLDGKHHATVVLERDYEATPSRVFAEFANPVVRAKWSAPSGDELIYDETAFKVGGRDVFRCGPKGAPKFQGETTYHVIVPGTCVVSSEVVEADGRHLAVSLNTLELEEADGGTKLKLTIQIVSSGGEGMIKGFESGNRSALEGLATHLAGLT